MKRLRQAHTSVTRPATGATSAQMKHSSQGPLPCFVFDNSEGEYGYGQVLPDAWCVPIVFAPAASANVSSIMTVMAERAGYDLQLFKDSDVASVEPPCTGPCMLGFETQQNLIDWHMAHQGRLGVAVVCVPRCAPAAFPLHPASWLGS